MAKPLLSADAICEAALQLLDEQGSDALSARSLATALKCSTRTLYQQVGKRDELIGRLIAHHFEGLQLNFTAADTWQQSARNWALALRSALLAHPNLYRLMTAEHRAPIASYVNALLRVLLKSGFSEELALAACRALTNVSMSLTLSEIKTPPMARRRGRRSESEIRFEDLIIARSGRNRDHFQDPPEVFAHTVQWLIAGIERDFQSQ